jgi:EmrB/QacA subfamily drug resistance transporter
MPVALAIRGKDSRTLALAAMCLAVFMVQLDSSVVNLALAAIRHDLESNVATLQWIVDAYNLTYASLMLTGGVTGDLYGHRRVFLAGAGAFGLGSLLCGLAQSTGVLIASRAFTGVGAALVVPASLAALTVLYPDPSARARAVSVWAGFNGVAWAVGPTLGGLLLEVAGWRSLFFINLPVVTVAIALAVVAVPESARPRERHLDIPGQALAIGSLAILVFAVIQGPVLGWGSAPILLSMAAAAGGVGGFIAWERRSPDPLVPLEVFRDRSFAAAVGAAALMTFGMYAMLLLVPLYLQTAAGHPPLIAGLMFAPAGVVFAAASPFAGRLATMMLPRILITAGFVLSGSSLVTMAVFAGAGQGVVVAALAVVGVALALQSVLIHAAVSGVPRERAGLASGLVNVGRLVGATLGVAVLGAVFATVAQHPAEPHSFLRGMGAALWGGALAEFTGAVLSWRWVGPRNDRAVCSRTRLRIRTEE